MDKETWRRFHEFIDEDMDRIDLFLSCGGKITAIFNKHLDYETIKYNC